MSTDVLAILGASGHGKVVADAALASGFWQSVVFFDDAYPGVQRNAQFPVLGGSGDLIRNIEKCGQVIVAIGDNKVRLAKQAELEEAGFELSSVVHPRSVLAPDVLLGVGSVVMAGAVINASASLGRGCIVNTNAVVEHDCILGDGVHISPGAVLGGGVRIGDFSWIGIGASIRHMISIGQHVMVGASAAVVHDLPDQVTAVGVPARSRKPE